MSGELPLQCHIVHTLPYIATSLSASDQLETVFPDQPSWTVEDSIRLAELLAQHGVDVLDVSSGGNHPQQTLPLKGKEAYHADYSGPIKTALGGRLVVGTVGGITTGKTAQAVLDANEADVVFVGRQFQRNPGSVWAFAEELGVAITVANQISWGFFGRGIVKKQRK